MRQQTESEADEQGLDLHKTAGIAVRRRWWAMGPFFLFGFIGLVAADKWALLYRSEAKILVEQQQVSERYVTPAVVVSLQTGLESITQQMLSQSALLRLAEQFHLLDSADARKNVTKALEGFRGGITIQVDATQQGRPGELAICTIAYTSTSASLAQRVTARLTDLFIEENLRSQTRQVADTTEFLESELERARRTFTAREETVRAYRRQHMGQLPDQHQSSLQILGSLREQLSASKGALERAYQQQIYLQSMWTQYQAMGRTSSTQPGQEDPSVGELPKMRKELTELLLRYTAEHPDVTALQARIAEREQLAKRAAAGVHTEPQSDVVSRSEGATTAALRSHPEALEVYSRLKSVASEIASLQTEIGGIRKRIEEYESRLELSPLREQELDDLTRSRDNARSQYDSLLQKKLQSSMAANLGKRQLNERFRILQPARLPEKPEGKVKIVAVGWLFGLLAGIALTILRQKTDAAVYDEDEVERWSSLPVLTSIPVMRSTHEHRRRWWSVRLEASVAVCLALVSAAATFRMFAS